jgi:hypothetical protein
MKMLTEADVIKIMRDEYKHRLLEVMKEADVFDDQGNLLVTKDLKVRHKKSQYEYTVDDVFADPNSGKLKIILRLPDEPRISPPGAEGILADTPEPEIIGEDELIISKEEGGASDIGEDELDDELVFVVDQAEFEKDYEVK